MINAQELAVQIRKSKDEDHTKDLFDAFYHELSAGKIKPKAKQKLILTFIKNPNLDEKTEEKLFDLLPNEGQHHARAWKKTPSVKRLMPLFEEECDFSGASANAQIICANLSRPYWQNRDKKGYDALLAKWLKAEDTNWRTLLAEFVPSDEEDILEALAKDLEFDVRHKLISRDDLTEDIHEMLYDDAIEEVSFLATRKLRAKKLVMAQSGDFSSFDETAREEFFTYIDEDILDTLSENETASKEVLQEVLDKTKNGATRAALRRKLGMVKPLDLKSLADRLAAPKS